LTDQKRKRVGAFLLREEIGAKSRKPLAGFITGQPIFAGFKLLEHIVG
jgi:hypothetical protein